MKLSSPYLNVLIVVGVIMFYVDVILFGVDEAIATRCTVDALCMVRINVFIWVHYIRPFCRPGYG